MQQLFVQKVILNTPVFTQPKLAILLTTAGSTDPFATHSINAMFKLFFSAVNATLIEHIAITNTDTLDEIQIDEANLTNILQYIN